MPVSWDLQYPFASESDANILRTHFEALRSDPNVSQWDMTMDHENPLVRSVHIVFHEGRDQPANPDYRFLNCRFPVRPPMGLTNVVPIIGAPSQGLSVIHNDVAVMPDVYDRQYTAISVQQHPAARRLPPWVLKGQWTRDKETGKCFCISGITAGDHRLFILGSPVEREGELLNIELDLFLHRFGPADIPREARLTAWEVLLRDVDEKD